MDLADDGIDTLTNREGVEPDVNADGSQPFRCPVWRDDMPEPITGEVDVIQAEFMDAISYWRHLR